MIVSSIVLGMYPCQTKTTLSASKIVSLPSSNEEQKKKNPKPKPNHQLLTTRQYTFVLKFRDQLSRISPMSTISNVRTLIWINARLCGIIFRPVTMIRSCRRCKRIRNRWWLSGRRRGWDQSYWDEAVTC